MIKSTYYIRVLCALCMWLAFTPPSVKKHENRVCVWFAPPQQENETKELALYFLFSPEPPPHNTKGEKIDR